MSEVTKLFCCSLLRILLLQSVQGFQLYGLWTGWSDFPLTWVCRR